MAQNCLICGIVDGSIPSKKIYEDDTSMAVLDVNGSNAGHCFLFPKNHYPIIEQVPNSELGKLFTTANRISMAIFEALKVQGTNLFVSNGIPAGQTVAHFMINIIPRKENDGINLQWEPKQLSEEEMSTVELKLKEEISRKGIFETPEKPAKASPPGHDVSEVKNEYFIRQLTRVP